MTDAFIVDLENYIRWEHKYGREAWCDPDDVQAALDEIERLRMALREIADGPRDADKSYVSLLHEIQSEARTALEGEKTDG
jgi:uncharacterized protein YdeI (YjbR/CyaY-like superfamily)